jgi:NDP-sugar pyrophosphorylase family protein
MAAGRGLRMMPLTNNIPKAMAPFKGSTLIANRIKKMHKFFNNVHVTVGYKGALLASHVIDLKVNSVFNTNNKGNAWWLFNTLIKNINGPVFVLTCDNIFEIDFQKILKEYEILKSPACMIVPVKPIKSLDGDFIFYNTKNVISKISRSKKSNYYCSGIQILNPFKINKIIKPSEKFNVVWKQLIEKKQIKRSNYILKKWYAVDNLKQLKVINN